MGLLSAPPAPGPGGPVPAGQAPPQGQDAGQGAPELVTSGG